MRSRLLPLVAGLLLLAGCADRPDGGGPDAAPDPAGPVDRTASVDAAWVAGFEAGSDEVPDRTTYVRFVPATGQARVTELRHPPFDSEPNPTTLVDADRAWVVVANAATRREQRLATVRVASLTGENDLVVDLRQRTGTEELRPLGWAFDPTEPGLLRVLDRTGRLFEVDVAGDGARELDRLEPGPGQSLAPLFDSATGRPLLRDLGTYEPVGGAAYDAGGHSLVDPYDVPRTDDCRDGRAEAGVQDGAGSTWVSCLAGRELRLVRGADGAWEQVGAVPGVPRGVTRSTVLLPPL